MGPARELSAEQLLLLGAVVTEMGERELQEAELAQPGVLEQLGALGAWSPQKVAGGTGTGPGVGLGDLAKKYPLMPQFKMLE